MDVGLNTRQHVRASLDMDVKVEVHMNHRSQVDLMGQKQQRDGHARDVSVGGLGVETETRLPRGTAVEIALDRLPIWGAEAPEEPSPITILGRVQRCVMASRQPTYVLAISFLEVGERMRQAIGQYVQAWAQSQGPESVQS